MIRQDRDFVKRVANLLISLHITKPACVRPPARRTIDPMPFNEGSPTSVSAFQNAVDASQITPLIWQGGYPARMRGFGALVLCARELQERPPCAADVRLIRAPMDDTDDPASQPAICRTAIEAARRVLDEISEGRTVLVTCAQGRNRSGLATALAILQLYGVSGAEALEIVRRARPRALTNPAFADFLERIPRREV